MCFWNAQFVPFFEHWRKIYRLKTDLHRHFFLRQPFTDYISQLNAKLVQVINYTSWDIALRLRQIWPPQPLFVPKWYEHYAFRSKETSHILFFRKPQTKCQRKPLLFYKKNNLFSIRNKNYEKQNIEFKIPNIDRILHSHTNTHWRKIRERSQTQPHPQNLPTHSYSLKHTQTHNHTHTNTRIRTHRYTPTHPHTHTQTT